MFEEILWSYLSKSDDLAELLTTYNGNPAVFNQTVPNDMDEMWDAKDHYNRAVFYADMQADTERKISGTLEIDVHMIDTDNIEHIAEVVKRLVDGYFFSGEQETIVAKWSATRYIQPENKEQTIAAVMFSLIAFPCQLTSEPDPIRVINDWTRGLIPTVKLIGYDKDLPEVWKPTDDCPAVYWRNAKVYPCDRVPSVAAGGWYTVQLYAHVFTTDTAIANELATVMCQRLNRKKVLRFSDGTYMRVDNKNQLQYGADVLRIGQLSVEGDYCVLQRSNAELIKRIIISD